MITLIGTLAAILLPALHAAREASRRTICQNHLRQGALAVLQHADAGKGKLPALWKTDHAATWENFSWRVDVLDELEEGPLAQSLQLDLSPLDPANRRAVGTVLSVFQCPSTPDSPRYVWDLGPSGEWPADFRAGACDYSGVFEVASGDDSRSLAGAWCLGPPEVGIFGENSNPGDSLGSWVVPDQEGPRRRTVPSSLQAIADGLSNTVLLAEQAGKPEQYTSPAFRSVRVPPSGPQPVGQFAWRLSEGAWAMAEMGTFHAPINAHNHAGPYGFHAGANVAMCDGSVRMLHAAMEWEVLSALLTRDGDEIIASTDWQ